MSACPGKPLARAGEAAKEPASFADIDVQADPGENPDKAQAEDESRVKPLDLEQEVRNFIRGLDSKSD